MRHLRRLTPITYNMHIIECIARNETLKLHTKLKSLERRNADKITHKVQVRIIEIKRDSRTQTFVILITPEPSRLIFTNDNYPLSCAFSLLFTFYVLHSVVPFFLLLFAELLLLWLSYSNLIRNEEALKRNECPSSTQPDKKGYHVLQHSVRNLKQTLLFY